VKDDLLITLEQLVLRKEKFDYILIETTGMANPGPVISTFWTDDQLGTYLKLDGVVCVVDSANILTYLNSTDISYEVRQQISYADRILLNKVDLVTPDKVRC
jgi:G3E family GTPase